MKKLFLIATCIFITLLSCKDTDCPECFTPPNPFVIELIDKTTGENLFTNGTYNADDISLTNILNNNSNIEFTFIDENDYNMIQVNTIGWQTEIVNYELKIKDQTIFNLYVDVERKSGNCCSYTEYNYIEIKNAEYTLDSESGIYKILIP